MNSYIPHKSRVMVSTKGFSLVETIIAMMILTFLSLGIIRGVLWTQRTAKYVTAKSVVADNIKSYINQIKSLDYSQLVDLAEQGSGHVLPMINLGNYSLNQEQSQGTTGETSFAEQLLDELVIDAWTEREILVSSNQPDEQSEPSYINLKIRLSINNAAAQNLVLDEQRQYIIVQLEYTWNPSIPGIPVAEKAETISFVIANQNLPVNELI